DRPLNATVLLNEIESFQRVRSRAWIQRVPCYLELTRRAYETLAAILRTQSWGEIQTAVVEDLNEIAGFSRLTRTTPDGEIAVPQHYALYGAAYSYHVAVNEPTPDRFAIINAIDSPPHQLEKRRENSFISSFEFGFGAPPNSSQAQEMIRTLELNI